MTKIGYKWKTIENLPQNWKSMESETLKNLSILWEEQKNKLDIKTITLFIEKLQRQWAIETGLLEKLYELDKGITYSMIEYGIDAIDIPHNSSNKPPSYVKSLIKDQQFVIEGIFDYVNGSRSLTNSYIKEIHATLTKSQNVTEAIDSLGKHLYVPLEKGKWKIHPNNPTRPDGLIHEYCPPIYVQDEMDQLIQWHEEHIDVAPEVEAAWLHHRFTQIHPFQDGNGRVARALATLVFIQKRLFPLIITNENRGVYIESLEKADNGNLEPLVSFFTQLAKDAFIRAISITETLLNNQITTINVLDAIKKTITDKSANIQQNNKKVILMANKLVTIARKEFDDILENLNKEINNKYYKFFVKESSNDSKYWFREQIYKIASNYDYYANLELYYKWIRLKLKNSRDCSIVFSLHSVSRNFSSVMSAIVFLEYREKTENYISIDGPHLLSERPYIFTANDDEQKISLSFNEWIHTNILNGLIMWQQNI